MFQQHRWLLLSLFSFTLTLTWFASCDASYMDNVIGDGFVRTCPDDGVPVCGARGNDYFLFPNQCLLNEANKDVFMGRTNFQKLPMNRCIHECRLACPKDYKPICAINLHTREKKLFVSLCELTKYACKTNLDWRVVKNGICDEDYSNNRLRLYAKAPKSHSVRKRSYDMKSSKPTQNRKQFSIFKPQISEDYKTPMEMSNMYQYSSPYAMPQIYQSPSYGQFQAEPRNMYSDDLINKLVSMPRTQTSLDSIPSEDQNYGATDVKPMQYAMNNMAFDYMPDTKYDQEGPIPEPVLRPTDSDYYPYHQPPPSYDTEMASSTTTKAPRPSEEIKLKTSTMKEKPAKKIIECKYGVTPLCGVLSNGTVRSFENICEMRTTNLYLKNTWVKLHEGRCDRCKYDCSREYEPICVQRNRVNYTMVNDCYYNMAICLDKISNWTKIADGECQRNTQIFDRYANTEPGFKYTSSYFAPTVTEKMSSMSSTERPVLATANEIVTNAQKIANEIRVNMPSVTESQKTDRSSTMLKRVIKRYSTGSPTGSKDASHNMLPPPTETYIMYLAQS